MTIFKRSEPSLLRDFRQDDSGEVTIAWVLITASIMAMGIMVMSTVGGGTEELSDKTGTVLAEAELPEY